MQRELGTPQPNAVTKDGRVYLTDGVSIKISLVDSRAYNTTGLAPEDGFIIRLPFARSGYLPYRGLPGFRRREPYYEFVALFKFDAARLHPYNGLAKYKEYIKEGRWYREAIIYEKEIVVSGADDNDFCFQPGDYEILTKFKALLYEAIQEEYYGPVAAY